MSVVSLLKAGPNTTLQDLGREGFLKYGLSRGGAMDRHALLEASALLGGDMSIAAIETPTGLQATVSAPQRVALTGAPMKADIDGRALRWNASHILMPDEVLTLRPSGRGVYGYVAFGGGFDERKQLGSVATHLGARLGKGLQGGDQLKLGQDNNLAAPPLAVPIADRFSGGRLRFVTGPQTEHYSVDVFERFVATRFRKSGQANRQAAKLEHAGAGFNATDQLGVVSDVIVPGDIQMTGAGEPYVLMAECQTIGGYPRIGAVLEEDMPVVAQAAPDSELWFEVISLEEADRLFTPERDVLRRFRDISEPVIRSPHDIANLLSYQLISGAVAGDEE
ncbi:urea amidolyase [Lentibacter algarum]|uniref:5-oxoprolinase subunit C family protein n=1 Tax=Lentibacter algarum TaxID=576131 RepID=UPI001C06549F|nr:urea amidolyase [Lentibacter algarum]MBU2980528.1 urea amidolyase [Lentibacter algarum]